MYGSRPQVWGGDPDCAHEWAEGGGGLRHENRNGLRGSQEQARGGTGTAHIFRFNRVGSAFCVKCGTWKGELGLEPTPDLYIEHLCGIFDEAKRVLRKTGTAWVVMGDTYWSAKGSCRNPGGGANSIESAGKKKGIYPLHRGNSSDVLFLQPKSLSLIPSRFAIGMCERGWLVRNVIVWQKPNCIPSSARDRFTVDYEFMFFLAKSRKYYFEQQFEPHRNRRSGNRKRKLYGQGENGRFNTHMGESFPWEPGPVGRNRRCVWKIPTQSFPGGHFAVFPEKLAETPIRAGCPGKGVVLDPFVGSGTTAAVARKLGRDFIGIEINPEYCRMARRRIAQSAGRSGKALKGGL